MIDPGKLADAAFVHAHEVTRKMTSGWVGAQGNVNPEIPTSSAEAVASAVRDAFIAGAKWNQDATGLGAVAMVGVIAKQLGLMSRFDESLGPANDSPDDPATRAAMAVEMRAVELVYQEAYIGGFTVAEANGWRGFEGSIICGPSDPGWQAGYLARVIIAHAERP
jgi:hypothetical protein